MFTELIGNAALWPAEQLINRAIDSDKHLQDLLSKFEGKAIQIRVLQPEFLNAEHFLFPALPEFIPIRFSIDDSSIRLTAIDSNEFALHADAQVSASANTFSKFLLTDASNRSLVSSDLTIEGDTQLVQDLFTVLNKLDIEWEDILSPMIGDISTHQLSQFVESATNWIGESRSRMSQNLDDYLKEEAKLFPSQIEIENFENSLDALKMRIDRTEARIKQLQSRLQSQK